jgi:RNA polymerase sigma-70 factor, ECF subfamily
MSNGVDPPATVFGPGKSFDAVVLPHLDAAYRLARWLMRDADVAEDVVQEASLRAFRYFRTFVGGDGRAWFLRIVRNTCYGWRRHRSQPPTDSFDDEQHSSARPQSDPEALLLQSDDATLIAQALSRLPDHFHQLLVLRELEGLSYRELSDVIGIPMGTVMSRLSRAREALRNVLDTELPQQPGISSRPRAREEEADAVLVSTACTTRRVRKSREKHLRRKSNERLRCDSRHRAHDRVTARRTGAGHHAATCAHQD